MKKGTLLFTFLVISSIVLAQKPKKTHDFNVFAKKINFSFTPEYIVNRLPNEKANLYISEKTNVSVADLKSKNMVSKDSIRKQLTRIQKTIPPGGHIFDHAEIKIIQENPIKIADITLHCKVTAGEVVYTLQNCVQTNASWFLGNGISVTGEGISGTQLAQQEYEAEKARRNSTGVLGKMNQIGSFQDSLNDMGKEERERLDKILALRKGHVAVPYTQKGLDKLSRYYMMEKVGQAMEGYYVKKDGEIVKAFIAYSLPENFVGEVAPAFSLIICNNRSEDKMDILNSQNDPNFKQFVKKDEIKAFYVGGQLFAFYPNVGWRIVVSEGAIHEFVSIVLVRNGDKKTYHTFNQFQKENGQEYGSFISSPSNNVFIDMMEDSPELQKELKDGGSRFELVIRYNYWYDLTYPETIKYIPTL